MSRKTHLIFAIGVVFICIGLGRVFINVILGQSGNIAFFVATGITLVVASWIHAKGGSAEPEAAVDEDSFVRENKSHLLLGAFILVGAAVVAAPLIALLMEVSRKLQPYGNDIPSDVGGALGFSSGVSYYAFLLGVLYFLSPKKGFPK